jgi:hypothetical protein
MNFNADAETQDVSVRTKANMLAYVIFIQRAQEETAEASVTDPKTSR